MSELIWVLFRECDDAFFVALGLNYMFDKVFFVAEFE